MHIGHKIRNWLWKGSEPLLGAVSEQCEKLETEFGELKKLVRRQGIQQESLIRELASRIDALPATGSVGAKEGRPDSLIAAAESFFHLEAVLPLTGNGPETREAVGIVWEKLESACREAGVEIVRRVGVPYDSRIHEALDRAPAGESPVVRKMTAPGFILNGRVLRPARVFFAEKSTAHTPEGEEIHGQ